MHLHKNGRPTQRIAKSGFYQRVASRITKSPSGDAALRRASSFSTVGTASPRSYRAYAFRDETPRREATSRSDEPLASLRRLKSKAVIAATSLPETSNSP